MCIETVIRAIDEVSPDTVIVELSVLRSGMAWSPVRLNAMAVPGNPLGMVIGTVNVPFVSVVTTRSNSILVPQTKPGDVLNWKGVRLVPRVLIAMAGYADVPNVTETPGVLERSVAVTFESTLPAVLV